MFDFIKFTTSLWGRITAVAMFFPFMNLLVQVLPLPYDALASTTVATAIVNAFMYLLAYVLTEYWEPAWLIGLAMVTLIIGFVSIEAYQWPYRSFTYSLIFSSLTFSFTSLAALTYVNQ